MINRLQFSIDIKAGKAEIWKALWDDKCYREWISAFGEGSYMVADNWNEGSKVFFLGPDKNGIYSLIEKHSPNKIVRFKHIGNVLNGKEQAIDEETKKWSGATETYSIIESTGYNTLTVDIDVLDKHLEFMSTRFPKALEIVKSNATKSLS